MDQLVPDKDNDGLIVIDFESWRPIFRQNFGVLEPYKNLSKEVVRKNAIRKLPEKEVLRRATLAFESAGKDFMWETLKLAKVLRPKAKWGYYAFPYCFNGRMNPPASCAPQMDKENRQISWLFEESDVIFPSVYMSEMMPVDYRVPMVKGRVKEARRMAEYAKPGKGQIYTYIRYCYTNTLRNLEEGILFNAIQEMINEGSEGVILWGSSGDLNTREKCEDFASYLKSTLEPVVRSFAAREPEVINIL